MKKELKRPEHNLFNSQHPDKKELTPGKQAEISTLIKELLRRRAHPYQNVRAS